MKMMPTNLLTKYKKYIVLCLCGLTMLYFYIFHYENILLIQRIARSKIMVKTKMKYILVNKGASVYLKSLTPNGQDVFKRFNCKYSNCYFTYNHSLLGDASKFDALLFQYAINNDTDIFKSQYRSPRQKYIFGQSETYSNYPLLDERINNFFNWTMTYKLDSDIKWVYIKVRDLAGNDVGPKVNMHWLNNMKPISESMKADLKTKRKAVAWFVSNCHPKSKRAEVATKINKELSKYNFTVDIYGACGRLKCPRDQSRCYNMIAKDYFFYLAFENSYSEDYVTEKVLNALLYNAVPIVYGSANYTRFMPDGAYLNAYTSSPEFIAKKIVEAIENPDIYYDYFKWKNHYTYHDYIDEGVCELCEQLNNKELVAKEQIYRNLFQWWKS